MFSSEFVSTAEMDLGFHLPRTAEFPFRNGCMLIASPKLIAKEPQEPNLPKHVKHAVGEQLV